MRCACAVRYASSRNPYVNSEWIYRMCAPSSIYPHIKYGIATQFIRCRLHRCRSSSTPSRVVCACDCVIGTSTYIFRKYPSKILFPLNQQFFCFLPSSSICFSLCTLSSAFGRSQRERGSRFGRNHRPSNRKKKKRWWEPNKKLQ